MERLHVRLADGEDWSLSVGGGAEEDPEFDALLAAAMDVEDHSEALRAELSLTIFLLRRNYQLSPDQLALLLTFTPDDPALSALQDAIHSLLVERMQGSRSAMGMPATDNQLPSRSNAIPGSI